MKIGVIAPPWFAVPPPGYGGTERVASYLTEGLVARGHDVTLFASGGSKTSARLISPFAEPPSADLGDPVVELRHLVEAYGYRNEFDIIHDHTCTGLLGAASSSVPTVHTVHGPITDAIGALLSAVSGRVNVVSISEHQRSTMLAGMSPTVIHNGLDPAAYQFGEKPGDYLLFVGRMSPEKGILDAIEIARRAGRPLLILAKVNEQPERDYLREYVAPAMRGMDAEIKDQIPEDEKIAAYANALVTLFPIHWHEPFGLVMIESMVTGTPVIAYPLGAAPEVIDDGCTGFLCAGIDDAVEAVFRVGDLDRRACREHVERNFTAALAVERHELLYERILSGTAPQPESADR